MSRNEVLELALDLQNKEKFIIIDELLKSMNTPNNEINEIWENEAVARLEAYRRGELKTIPMDEVFK